MKLNYRTYNKTNTWIASLGCMFLFSFGAVSQVFNANYNDINFGGAGVTITNKVGNGTQVGDVVLYENVITITGQQIDAIIRTDSIDNGTCTDFDYTGTSQNNLQRWFSPRFNFNSGGGYAEFKIEFILGGSFNNGSNTGTSITLQNIMVSSYDIDGNGNANSNQYCDFGGFSIAEVGNPTLLTYSYDSSSGLTRFSSTVSTNNTNAADERHRVRCQYSAVSNFTLRLGGGGSGAAYYFIDFSGDPPFSSSTSIEVPILDLDTSTPGLNHDTTFAGSAVQFTAGASNIIYSGASIDSLKISFENTMILDGTNEILYFDNSTGSQIALDFTNGQAIPNITLGGETYTVQASVKGSKSKLVFYNNGGTMLLADAESFLDSIYYNNILSDPTIADRVFDVVVQDGEFASGVAQFNIEYDVTLPVEMVSFGLSTNENSVFAEWSTVSEIKNDYFAVERSQSGSSWEKIGEVTGAGTTTETQYYSFEDRTPLFGTSYYRLVQYDFDGTETTSEVKSVVFSAKSDLVKLIVSGKTITALVSENWSGRIFICNNQGEMLFEKDVTRFEPRQIDIPLHPSSDFSILRMRCISSTGEVSSFSVLL